MASKKRPKRPIRQVKKPDPADEDLRSGASTPADKTPSRQVQAASTSPKKADPHAAEREAARKARREAKENPPPPPATKPESPKPKQVTPKAVAVVEDDLPPPADLGVARRRKEMAKAAAGQNPIVLELDERLRYKMEAMDRRYNEAVDRVKGPILRMFESKIKPAIQQAVDADQACRASRKAQIECVNEIIDALSPDLPNGYAVTLIEGEKGIARAEYAPDQVGKKLPVPEPSAKE